MAYGEKVNFSVEQKVWKKRKNSFFGTPSSTSDFSDPIWARNFRFGLFDSLWSVLDDFTMPMAQSEK